jgi:pimeloyl-ACP methyl ester carboxylesterase
VRFFGSKDQAVPEAFARRACELLPNSQLIVLDSGHFLPVSEPIAVSDALGHFLGSDEAEGLAAAAGVFQNQSLR